MALAVRFAGNGARLVNLALSVPPQAGKTGLLGQQTLTPRSGSERWRRQRSKIQIVQLIL